MTRRRPRRQRVSGHVVLRNGPRGPVYYLKYRLPDGRQVKRRLGPAWNGRGRPTSGHYTRRTAQEALQEVLADARRGTLAGMETVNASFADAAAEWLRYVEHDRDVKPSTLSDYRHMAAKLNRDFGELPIESITALDIERWKGGLPCSNRTAHKYLLGLNGIFKRAMRVYGVPGNPMALVERPRIRHSNEIDVFSPAEVRALLRATPDETLRAFFMTAAFTGLRMGELLALRWRNVDFGAETIRVERSFTIGGESSPKSGKSRSVPMVREVAAALARLGQRERFVGDDDLVFAGAAGGHMDSRQVRPEYKAALARAGLRRAALPRPEAHVRHPRGGAGGVDPRAQGVDGARERPDDDALPALQVEGRRGEAARLGVRRTRPKPLTIRKRWIPLRSAAGLTGTTPPCRGRRSLHLADGRLRPHDAFVGYEPLPRRGIVVPWSRIGNQDVEAMLRSSGRHAPDRCRKIPRPGSYVSPPAARSRGRSRGFAKARNARHSGRSS